MSDAIVRMGYTDADLAEGLRRTSSRMRRFQTETKASFTGIAATARSAFTSAMGFIGVGAGVAGLKALADEYDRINDLARQLDESPEALQRLGAMAKLNGSDLESVARSMNKLNKEVAAGNAAEAFRELGIEANRFLSLNADEQMIQLAAAFQEAERKGKGLTAAYDLFGKSASDLLPLLRTNVDELRRFRDMDVVSADQIAQVAAINDRFDALAITVKTKVIQTMMNAADGFRMVRAAIAGMISGEGGENTLDKELGRIGTEMGDALQSSKKKKTPIVPAEKEEATAVQREKDRAESQAESLRMLREELQILRLRSSHQQQAADQMQREVNIRREALRIAKETGLSEKESLEIARKKQAMEDESKEKSRRIQGYKRNPDAPKNWGIDAEWRKPSDLDRFKRLQKTITLPDGRTVRMSPAFDRGTNTSQEILSRRTQQDRGAVNYARERSGHEQRMENIMSSVDDRLSEINTMLK